MKNSQKDKKSKYLIIAIIWLAIWEIVSLFVHNRILLVGPLDVILTLIIKCGQVDFYKSIGMSLVRILSGFLVGSFLGIVLGILSWKNHFVEELLQPLMAFMKAAPIASFVVLFLIWWNSDVLAFAICICVSLPQIYISVLQGCKSTDIKLIEMSRVFNLSGIDKLHYIYRPAVWTHLEGAIKLAVGMSFKAGVAAEVIGTPDNSIGNQLYFSKIYLDTAGLLAWTLVIILLSIVCEKLLLIMIKKYFTHEFSCKGTDKKSVGNKALRISCLNKNYGDKIVLSNYSNDFEKGQVHKFDWPSGKGKTTLFKIIAGIEVADSGQILPEDYLVSMVFQEDRLVEGFSGITNVALVCGDKIKAREGLLKFLDEEDLNKPVYQLSGGQKRRVAIVRALLAPADIAIFDEPYEGLDEAIRRKVQEVIIDNSKDKVTLLASHIEI